MTTRTALLLPLVLAAFIVPVACSSDDGSEFDEGGGRGGGAAGGNGGSGGSLIGSGGSIQNGGRGGQPDGGGGACATVNAKADLEPVFLAFAFDVSGSMGQKDYLWHDPVLKWQPVVAATQQFFEAATSRGISASLRFFPDRDNDIECTAATYQTPEVPMTALPSPAFRAAISVVDSENKDPKIGWRGGTPTVYVVRGTIAYVKAQRTQKPGRYAIVLVTDGYPQGCTNNTIANVVTDVRAAEQDEIPTYVIGVLNPDIDGAPRTLSDLDDVAVAGGGNETAFIIDTGTPTQTSARLTAAINTIRGKAVSCNVAIPAPPDGRSFDKRYVRVDYKAGGGQTTPLTYDQACTAANAWRYDNPAAPTQIELCASTCTTVQADPGAELAVGFTCDPVIIVPE